MNQKGYLTIILGASFFVGFPPGNTFAQTFIGQEVSAERLLGAFRVKAVQISQSWQQQSTTNVKAQQASTSAILHQQDAMDIARAKDNMDYLSGQSYKSCQVAQGVSTINSAHAGRNTYMQTISARDNGWFTNGGEQRHILSSLIGLRKSVYCSQSEQTSLKSWCNKELGKKKEGGFPAGNSDSGVWLLRRGYGAEEAMTGMDYVDTIAPLPTISAPKDAQTDIQQKRQHTIYAGAFIGAARTAITRTILDGMEDTETDQATEDMVR